MEKVEGKSAKMLNVTKVVLRKYIKSLGKLSVATCRLDLYSIWTVAIKSSDLMLNTAFERT